MIRNDPARMIVTAEQQAALHPEGCVAPCPTCHARELREVRRAERQRVVKRIGLFEARATSEGAVEAAQILRRLRIEIEDMK
jgi:pyruvate-formate lyase-activating enzyme